MTDSEQAEEREVLAEELGGPPASGETSLFGADAGAAHPARPESLPPGQEFLLPIHEFVEFTDREVAVIDHPAFQRLFRVQQLGQTNLVFRGATHKRGEHSLGAVHTVTMLADAIDKRAGTLSPPSRDGWVMGKELSGPERAFARLAALLHDVGHLAAGHTIEDELGLLAPHDADHRLDLVFDRTRWGGRDVTTADNPVGETLRARVDRLYADDASEIDLRHAEGTTMTASGIVTHIVSKDQVTRPASEYTSREFRLGVIRDLVGNTLCADLLDYIHRDWHYIGKPRFFDKRLLHYLEVRRRPKPHAADKSEEHAVVLNLLSDKPGRYRSDAVTAILDILDSRYQLWEVALLHRTKTAAAAMLERGVGELVHFVGYFGDDQDRRSAVSASLLETLLEATDFDLYRLLGEEVTQSGLASFGEVEDSDVSADLLWRVGQRVLHKQAAVLSIRDADSAESVKRAGRMFAPSKAAQDGDSVTDGQRTAAALNRLQTLRLLEQEFGLSRGSLAMYCTPFGMGQKLAEVQVFHEGGVAKLATVDQSTRLTGGHLQAQLERFNNLWRASLFASGDAMARLEEEDLLDDLGDAFKAAVGILSPADSARMMKGIARKFKDQMPEFAGRSVTSDPRVAARGDDVPLAYPSEVPSIRAFLN